MRTVLIASLMLALSTLAHAKKAETKTITLSGRLDPGLELDAVVYSEATRGALGICYDYDLDDFTKVYNTKSSRFEPTVDSDGNYKLTIGAAKDSGGLCKFMPKSIIIYVKYKNEPSTPNQPRTPQAFVTIVKARGQNTVDPREDLSLIQSIRCSLNEYSDLDCRNTALSGEDIMPRFVDTYLPEWNEGKKKINLNVDFLLE